MKKKRKKLPGVTLVELVIVMAIFSGIAVGALAMVRPSMQLHSKISSQERAVAAVDSIGRYMQDNLRYADNVMIYKNTGITDIDVFINFPFNLHAYNIAFKLQKRTEVIVDDERTTSDNHSSSDGGVDYYKFINPLSYFVQYHYRESILYDGTPQSTCDDYFKKITVYIMEIKTNGEINVYGYPLSPFLADGTRDAYYAGLLEGVCVFKTYPDKVYTDNNAWARHIPSINYSFSPEFSSKETRTVTKADGTAEDIQLGVTLKDMKLPGGETYPGDASKGMSFEFEYSYMGATQVIDHQYHEVAVNFLNANKTHDVNDIQSYPANSFEFFDWSNPPVNESVKCVGTGSNLVEQAQLDNSYVAEGGNIYIVYSQPEISP